MDWPAYTCSCNTHVTMDQQRAAHRRLHALAEQLRGGAATIAETVHPSDAGGDAAQPVGCTDGDACISACDCSGGSGPSTSGAGGEAYATATGRPSSYARVHGEVSRRQAVWRRIDTLQKEALHEVKYEKSLGEGIARVSRACRTPVRSEGGGEVALPSGARSPPCCRPPTNPLVTWCLADHHQPPREAKRLYAQDRCACRTARGRGQALGWRTSEGAGALRDSPL